MTQAVEIDVRSKRIKELEEYLQKEGIFLEENTETIIDKLITGKLRDLGGLTAIRGFVYQYYVAIYYMIKMLYPKSIDTWWEYVVIEYFDDVTLLSEKEVRFIQVKTIREKTSKFLNPNDFYKRSKPREDNIENHRLYFNSWLDKLFFNYDYFFHNHLKEADLECGKFTKPQFEIATNSPFSSSDKISAYTTNSKYDMNYLFAEDDKFFEKLKSVKVGEDEETTITFNEVMKEDLEFYLNSLFINHLGSSVELKETIIEMIIEIIDRSEIESRAIAEYIFGKFFSKVFTTTYNDNPNISLEELTFSKKSVEKLFQESKVEGTEILANAVKDSSVFSMFERVISSLSDEIEKSYKNEKIKKELLETLRWFYNSCIEEFERDPKYLSVFLHKLFEMENTLPVDNYLNSDNEFYLKNSIEYIVNCLAFYIKRKSEFKNSKLLFHYGEFNSEEKLLFTIYNAQNKKDTISVKNGIATIIQDYEETKKIREDFYCLIIDAVEQQNNNYHKIAAFLGISNIEEDQPKIIEPVQNLMFFNSQRMKEFIWNLKQSKEDALETLKDENIIKNWRELVEIQN